MSESRDPVLESLFAEGQAELADDGFTEQLMARVAARRKRVLARRFTIAALFILLELLLDSPLQHSVNTLTVSLGNTIYETDNEWLAFVLAPVNSFSGLLGLLLLGLHFLYRKIFY